MKNQHDYDETFDKSTSSLESSSSFLDCIQNNEDNLRTNDPIPFDEDSQGSNGIIIRTHYIILSHGLNGNPKEMGYVQKAINTTAASTKTNNEDKSRNCRIVVHSMNCNYKKTNDGIAKGGKRLADEIQMLIKNDTLMQSRKNGDIDIEHYHPHHVSLSLIGFSLGGLYSRYALSCLPSELLAFSESKRCTINIKIHYNTFITAASPHLGCASHTYMYIPRFMEKMVGTMFSKTGKDLFRMRKKKQYDKSLIFEMGTNYERFLKPLSKFKKRIAYVNAFQTDFLVPTTTAAFLSEDSTYPHTVKYGCDKNRATESFLVATVTTEMSDFHLRTKVPYHKTKRTQDLIISNKLDALGWSKVFIDTRGMNPIPRIQIDCRSEDQSTGRLCWDRYCDKFLYDSSKNKTATPSIALNRDRTWSLTSNDSNNSAVATSPISTSCLSSKQLKQIMTSRSNMVDIPLGHCLLIANSKSRSAERFYSKGRPIVDMLAKSLLNELR